MRILQVVTDTDRRGAQVFAVDLHTALERRGHAVTTSALAAGRNPERLPIGVLGRRRRGPGTLVNLRRAMKGADVVVAHGSATASACAAASIGVRTPFVYRQISDLSFWAGTRWRRARVRCYLARARLVVALAEQSRRQLVDLVGVPAARVRVVPNGVPAPAFTPVTGDARAAARAELGVPPGGPLVLFVGALVPEKGADVAVQAIKGTRAHLAVVGDGPERSELERLARSVVPDRVVFCGSLPDVRPAYAAADVVVLPSRGGDTMPATLIEAGLCALPVVTTDVGAIAEVVLDGTTGVVTRAGDAVGFGEALVALCDDAARASRLGEAARRHCLATFDVDVVAASWERVLGEAVAAG